MAIVDAGQRNVVIVAAGMLRKALELAPPQSGFILAHLNPRIDATVRATRQSATASAERLYEVATAGNATPEVEAATLTDAILNAARYVGALQRFPVVLTRAVDDAFFLRMAVQEVIVRLLGELHDLPSVSAADFERTRTEAVRLSQRDPNFQVRHGHQGTLSV